MTVKIGYASIPPGVIISDERGEKVALPTCKGDATLLVVDLQPGGQAPRPFFYVLVPADGSAPLKADHPYPPSPALEVRPCR